VTFEYGQNGRLAVRAELPTANCEAKLVVERASGLSRADLTRWTTTIKDGLRLDDQKPTAAAAPVASSAGAGYDAADRVPSRYVPPPPPAEDSLAIEDIDVGPKQPPAAPPDDTALGRFLDGLGD
jgi:hypothetical protein